jgi:hypothetical protein
LVEFFALPGGRENDSRDEIQEGRQRRRETEERSKVERQGRDRGRYKGKIQRE